ncbi:hypothetical protein [Escherichia coli]|uniref:hypothetical protein n=1 Tax=Escherichia coli TaxID=562 RepID=UPI0020BE865A|nr:hypothetical protein [Escherichia coli]
MTRFSDGIFWDSGLDPQAGKEAAEQHRQQQADLQKRLDAAGNKLAEATTRHATDLQGVREQYAGEVKELKAQHARNESDLQRRLDAAEKKLAEAITNHAIEIKGIKEQHTGEIKELKAQHARSEKELQNRLDTELKARQAALDKALRDATDAREAKATLTGEL